MATPTYPAELPVPSQFKFSPFPQVLATDTDIGPKTFRRRSRQPGGFASVEFRFLETEYSVYVEWFKTDLRYGHKWFWIPLPSPNGLVPLLARFTAKPSATLGGHRFWTVTGTIEILDRFNIVTYAVLTSLLYPLEVIERLDVLPGELTGSVTDAVGTIDVSSRMLSGDLAVTIAFKNFRSDPENIDVQSRILSGDLIVTIAFKSFRADPENIDVASNMVAGTLTTTIQYVTHYDPAGDEGVNVSSNIVSGTLT